MLLALASSSPSTASNAAQITAPAPGLRLPTLALAFALAILAIRPDGLYGSPVRDLAWHAHHALLLGALAANAWLFGLHRSLSWPVAALLGAGLVSTLLGTPSPASTLSASLLALSALALPWLFGQVMLEPGARGRFAPIIAFAPIASVLLGGLADLIARQPVLDWHETLGTYRLQGLAGIAADLALLAFAGLAVALHEWARRGRSWAGLACWLNLVILLFTGTRMALSAGLILVLLYGWRAPGLRARLRASSRGLRTSLGLALLCAGAYAPILYRRLFSGQGGTIGLSGRDEIWAFFWHEFLESPLFGRGLGAGFAAGGDLLNYPLPLPHNEYLHLLVLGGLFGAACCLVAIGLWWRELRARLASEDHPLLDALLPALLVYAFTENILSLPSGLGVFAYLGVLACDYRTRRRAPASASGRLRRRPF